MHCCHVVARSGGHSSLVGLWKLYIAAPVPHASAQREPLQGGHRAGRIPEIAYTSGLLADVYASVTDPSYRRSPHARRLPLSH